MHSTNSWLKVHIIGTSNTTFNKQTDRHGFYLQVYRTVKYKTVYPSVRRCSIITFVALH